MKLKQGDVVNFNWTEGFFSKIIKIKLK